MGFEVIIITCEQFLGCVGQRLITTVLVYNLLKLAAQDNKLFLAKCLVSLDHRVYMFTDFPVEVCFLLEADGELVAELVD